MKRLTWAVAFGLVLAAGCAGRPGDQDASLVQVQVNVYEPAAGAVVDVYRPGQDLRGPPYTRLGPLGGDGRAAVELPPGEYVLVARRRRSGEEVGPVKAGDLKTDPMTVHVEPGRPLDLRMFAYRKTGNEKRPFALPGKNWTTSIRGRVLDPEGRPVEGVRVHVYDHIQMSERPRFVSAKTGPDGRYEIRLPKGGTYYLCARNRYGGPPEVGELYGRYDQGTIDPSAVIVKDGETVSGVDITVHKIW